MWRRARTRVEKSQFSKDAKQERDDYTLRAVYNERRAHLDCPPKIIDAA